MQQSSLTGSISGAHDLWQELKREQYKKNAFPEEDTSEDSLEDNCENSSDDNFEMKVVPERKK